MTIPFSNPRYAHQTPTFGLLLANMFDRPDTYLRYKQYLKSFERDCIK